MKCVNLALLLSIVLLTSCSKGGDSSGPALGIGPGKQGDPLTACNDVVTDEAVTSFNARQSSFRITAMGASVKCSAVVNENGVERRVDRTGHSDAGVLSKLKFDKVVSERNGRTFTVRAESPAPTAEELKTVARELGLPADSNHVIYADYREPGYVRFQKGTLFYVSFSRRTQEGEKTYLQFQVTAENGEEIYLQQAMNEFQRNQEGMEILWYPENQLFHRQVFAHTDGWSSLSALDLLKSYVRDRNDRDNRKVISFAISNSIAWQLDVSQVHSALPELYRFADSEWTSPTIADNTAQDLLQFLRYLVKINPSHSRAPVLEAYERISRFHDSNRMALSVALDYVEGRTWNKAQFDRIVELSESLFEGFHSRSWGVAQLIAQRTNFDREQSTFVSSMGAQLGSRGLIRNTNDSIAIVESIYGKIAIGLSRANSNLYFRAFDAFKNSFRASSEEAEMGGDQLILTGKLNENSFSLCFNFMQWLINTPSARFSEALEIANNMRSFDQATISLFQSVYSWLNNDVGIFRTDALKKASIFVGNPVFTADSFRMLKGYYTWLSNTMGVFRTDALAKSEAMVAKGVSMETIKTLEDLAGWYMNVIGIFRTDALTRAEHMVLEVNLSFEELKLMKTVVEWLTNTIGLYRTDAATKGELYLTGPHRLNATILAQLKTQTEWYINKIGVFKSDAFKKVDEQVFTNGLSAEQFALIRESAEWLINTVGIFRSDAAKKSEDYILLKQMTKTTYRNLVREYDEFIRLGKYRTEALRLAEEKVLH